MVAHINLQVNVLNHSFVVMSAFQFHLSCVALIINISYYSFILIKDRHKKKKKQNDSIELL